VATGKKAAGTYRRRERGGMAVYFPEEESGSFSGSESIELGTLMNWAGAIVSFLLMVGLAVWGYQLLMRDVTGIPVVRALEGPMRIAPEDPGGEQAEYQGFSVTQVAVEGAREAPTERVVLAPPPVALTEEDQPVAALIPDTPSTTPEEVEEVQAAPKSAIEMALAEALGETVSTASESGGPEPAGNTVTEAARVRVVPASVAGVAESPRPASRPARLERAVAVLEASEPEPARTAPTFASGEDEIAAADIPPGTRLVQLGAFPSEEAARAAWTDLEGEFGDYLEDKQRVVQEASAGGSTFYRLRAMGFDDLSEARRFCSVLVAESANCIPVIRR
jgi:hypothetical protein